MEGNVFDPEFRELLIRWYEWAVFQPVMRLHGDREPFTIPALDDRDWGGGYLHTGQDNEMWSYGEENFAIMKKHYELRRSLLPYLKKIFREAHENGSPLLRAKIYAYMAAGGLLWSNWCEFKSIQGIEFGEYSLRQYRFAKDFSRYASEFIIHNS